MSKKDMTDSEYLQWLHDRIVNVYGESENVDFLIKFREIIKDIELPYIKSLEPYGLKQDEMKLVLSTIFNQSIRIRGRSVYNTNGNRIYYETSNGSWVKYEYDINGNKIYSEDNNGFWRKYEYDTNDNQIYSEDSNGYWYKKEYDEQGREVYYENSNGYIEDIKLIIETNENPPPPNEKLKEAFKQYKTEMNMTNKEKLILDILTKGLESIIKVGEEQEKMLKDLRDNGYGDIHPFHRDEMKSGISYTHGYSVGHKCLAEQVIELLNMTEDEITSKIEDDKRIEEENKKYMEDLLKSFKDKNDE